MSERVEFSNSGSGPWKTTSPPVAPVPRTNVHDLIRGAHDAGLVFDHHDGVAGVAEFLKDAHEAVGVTRVQADAGFVENEESIDQTRAETGGEIDALGFATAQRARRAIQCQVAEADFVEYARRARTSFSACEMGSVCEA